jgi:hypothetical protein
MLNDKHMERRWMNDFFIWCEVERNRLQAGTNESRLSLAQRILELDTLLFEANIILMPRGPKGKDPDTPKSQNA